MKQYCESTSFMLNTYTKHLHKRRLSIINKNILDFSMSQESSELGESTDNSLVLLPTDKRLVNWPSLDESLLFILEGEKSYRNKIIDKNKAVHGLSSLLDDKYFKLSSFINKKKIQSKIFLRIIAESPAVLYTINLTIFTEICRVLGCDDVILEGLNSMQITRKKDFKYNLTHIADFLYILSRHLKTQNQDSEDVTPYKKLTGRRLKLD
mmetsp:Transcript_11463/g.12975  ORF Transcript_11463/g.12975 Transcript_11463/m.12975 type:complete len:209 (+) Transcript_11463:424-1050(+)